jgi:hypothetical protein
MYSTEMGVNRQYGELGETRREGSRASDRPAQHRRATGISVECELNCNQAYYSEREGERSG